MHMASLGLWKFRKMLGANCQSSYSDTISDLNVYMTCPAFVKKTWWNYLIDELMATDGIKLFFLKVISGFSLFDRTDSLSCCFANFTLKTAFNKFKEGLSEIHTSIMCCQSCLFRNISRNVTRKIDWLLQFYRSGKNCCGLCGPIVQG